MCDVIDDSAPGKWLAAVEEACSSDGSVIGLDGFAGAVPDEHVVPAGAVEGGQWTLATGVEPEKVAAGT